MPFVLCFLIVGFFRKNCLFVESAILWGCAGYFALKYSTRQRAGAEFMPITKLELAPHHGDFAGMCMLYHTHQKRGRAGLPAPRRKPCPIAHVTFMIYTAPFVGGRRSLSSPDGRRKILRICWQLRGRAAISGPKAACGGWPPKRACGRRALWPPDRICHKSR